MAAELWHGFKFVADTGSLVNKITDVAGVVNSHVTPVAQGTLSTRKTLAIPSLIGWSAFGIAEALTIFTSCGMQILMPCKESFDMILLIAELFSDFLIKLQRARLTRKPRSMDKCNCMLGNLPKNCLFHSGNGSCSFCAHSSRRHYNNSRYNSYCGRYCPEHDSFSSKCRYLDRRNWQIPHRGSCNEARKSGSCNSRYIIWKGNKA